MRTKIPQNFIQDLISQTDIIDIIQKRIELIRKANNYVALCPFHSEKTPSFTVSKEKQFYYCFGCGAHGNSINFLMNFDRMTFVEAIETLANIAGLQVPQTLCEQHGSLKNNLQEIFQLLEEATTFYTKGLKQSPQAIDYLKSRQLTGEIAKEFQLGFASTGWENLYNYFRRKGKNEEVLKKSGLFIVNKSGRLYDRFRGRIIFPIKDKRGRAIGFGGRNLNNEQPKYLNSSETAIFHKGDELYGLHEVLKKNRFQKSVLIVEGYMDVISLAQHGVDYAVATLGTSINISHLHKLASTFNEIIFCFDGDLAGKNAAKRALEISLPLMRKEIKICFMFLPKNQDPDTMIKAIGKVAFEARVKKAINLSDLFFLLLEKEIPPTSLDNKACFAQRALKLLEKVPEGIFRKLMKKKLAIIIKVDEKQLDIISSKKDKTLKTPPSNFATDQTQLFNRLVAWLLNFPTLINSIEELKGWKHLTDDQNELISLLISLFKSNQELTIGHLYPLIDIKHHLLIAQLANWHPPFNDEVSIKKEVLGAIQQLNLLEKQNTLNLLTKKESKTKKEREKIARLLKELKMDQDIED